MSVEKIYHRKVDLSKPETMKVLIWPDTRLHEECQDVTRFDTDEDNCFLQKLMIDMAYTMVNNKGIGLAAPQVGISANFFVLLIKDKPIPFINPKIVETSDDMYKWEEGCLSVPGYFEMRERPDKIIVDFQTPTGEQKSIELRGIWAFAFQHEYDHLQGKLFVDNLSWIKKRFAEGKVKKYLKRVPMK